MQLVGPAFGETLVLEVAAAYERCTEWRSLRPWAISTQCVEFPLHDVLASAGFVFLSRGHRACTGSRTLVSQVPIRRLLEHLGMWNSGGANRTCLLHPESRTRYDSFVSKGSADAVRTIRVEPRVDRTSSRSLPQRKMAETGPALAYDRCRRGEICPDSASSFGFPKAASSNTHR